MDTNVLLYVLKSVFAGEKKNWMLRAVDSSQNNPNDVRREKSSQRRNAYFI